MLLLRNVKNIKGRIALVRADLNVESVKDILRIEKSVPTIQFLLKQGGSVVVLSHRGRPNGKVVKELSLKSIATKLAHFLNHPVKFLADWHPKELRQEIRSAKAGSVFMLENLRFHPEEDQDEATFAHQLASLGDFFVNDSFAVDHHKGASIDQVPQFMPSCAGLLLEEEISNLSKVMRRPKKPLIVILAGGKAADKFAVIENLYAKADKFLIGGVLANTFFKAQGMKIDSSIVDFDILSKVKKMLGDKKILLPMDWVTNDSGKILDLGSLSTLEFIHYIKKAGTIIWNGPLGQFEDPRFRAGTIAIADAVTKSRAFSVVGGGETANFILDQGLADKVGFLSTGGGAMLAFLAGKEMPGIAALG